MSDEQPGEELDTARPERVRRFRGRLFWSAVLLLAVLLGLALWRGGEWF